ncbi:hypothetical protein LRS10_22150 [Phenylobacterium sp. J426]|uniref:hypothetical protein n=1 Tax=Phenylobacterium sp. J426 TaxID=2898439 RepID=UPI002151077C|nr:hypothetical protein [Phenylobacterium sp. J426]MCR5876612.1 hypothetical protein [Phenylobacterium sp. J426]
MSRTAYQVPLQITVVEGDVVFLGPGNVHGALTPTAARLSATALLEAADRAETGLDVDLEPKAFPNRR